MSIWVVVSLFIALAILLAFAVADTRSNQRRAVRWMKSMIGRK